MPSTTLGPMGTQGDVTLTVLYTEILLIIYAVPVFYADLSSSFIPFEDETYDDIEGVARHPPWPAPFPVLPQQVKASLSSQEEGRSSQGGEEEEDDIYEVLPGMRTDTQTHALITPWRCITITVTQRLITHYKSCYPNKSVRGVAVVIEEIQDCPTGRWVAKWVLRTTKGGDFSVSSSIPPFEIHKGSVSPLPKSLVGEKYAFSP